MKLNTVQLELNLLLASHFSLPHTHKKQIKSLQRNFFPTIFAVAIVCRGYVMLYLSFTNSLALRDVKCCGAFHYYAI